MTDTGVFKEMDVLRKAMLDDPAYAYGWHCNIAMAMFDSMPESFWMPDKKEYHKITNEAATRFMKNCFGVDTSYNMLDGYTGGEAEN